MTDSYTPVTVLAERYGLTSEAWIKIARRHGARYVKLGPKPAPGTRDRRRVAIHNDDIHLLIEPINH
ncbi:MAG: hypothetical protein FWG25_03725 [Promicromonosporaceae bacterium]|nr:hypothetical protein [Promicromonosporaceae bacterium]